MPEGLGPVTVRVPLSAIERQAERQALAVGGVGVITNLHREAVIAEQAERHRIRLENIAVALEQFQQVHPRVRPTLDNSGRAAYESALSDFRADEDELVAARMRAAQPAWIRNLVASATGFGEQLRANDTFANRIRDQLGIEPYGLVGATGQAQGNISVAGSPARMAAAQVRMGQILRYQLAEEVALAAAVRAREGQLRTNAGPVAAEAGYNLQYRVQMHMQGYQVIRNTQTGRYRIVFENPLNGEPLGPGSQIPPEALRPNEVVVPVPEGMWEPTVSPSPLPFGSPVDPGSPGGLFGNLGGESNANNDQAAMYLAFPQQNSGGGKAPA